ncbi:hypothetical protein GCM10010517_55610 [Streptosporangium fragile]|uniref:Uncharacterized protein n=1 Tax=Streptosporangium fragile TaxID=46186 RepID=A0ABP6IKE0_9ACTN
MLADRDAPAVVDDPHTVVGEQGDLDAVGMTGQGLVDRVVHDLVDEVMKTTLSGGADVHARALTDRLKSFENGD